MSIQVCRDPSDAVALYLPQRLYLKSFAKLNISVQLPSNKVHGKSISNWELMEKLRKMIQPDSFSVLKVMKHSSEMIRFDAEMENPEKLERVISRLTDRIVQLKEYPDQLKVRVAEAKSEFPSRHDWDSFFRDATDMDEMKPGERPDTVHICNLPIRWFVHETDNDDDAPPSENIFKRAFEKFGSIRQVDVPAADPFRMQMKTAIRGITTPPQEAAVYFEGYIQFSEYVSFVRCMDALRGRKLLLKRDDISEWCAIKVEFDKTKHMTDAAVKRRAIVRERLSARKRAKEEEEQLEKDKIARREAKERQKHDRAEREKLEKMREREERRKKKQLAKLMERDDVDLQSKVAEEQRKLMKTQKKLQAIRLIEELFRRIELRPELQRTGGRNNYYMPGERTARARIFEKLKRQQEELLQEQRTQLQGAFNGRIVIRSALETKKPRRESSVSSISSEERPSRSRIKTEKLSTPEREIEYNKATAGVYGMPYGFGYPFPCPPGYGYPPPQTSAVYYPVRGAYYPPPAPDAYVRRPYRARARGRGRPRMPFFNGPDASHQYYKYFKKLTEAESRNEHDERDRSRSRSRRRSYSRSRSRSRSRRRSHSRSRSRNRRSRSRRSRSRSRRSRSRSRRSRSYQSRSRSRSHRRSRSRSRRSRTRSQSHARTDRRSPSAPLAATETAETTHNDVTTMPRDKRARSWTSPKQQDKAWSKSPTDT